MFYRLKPDFALRGWEGMAWVLVQKPDNRTRPMTRPMFQALTLCDGETQLSDSLLTGELRDALNQGLADGLIETSSQPRPLDPWQYYRYYPNRHVEKVLWSITGRCNFRCRHCYMDAPEAAMGELSTEQALDLIDQMADCGVLRVSLTGGEPLVRKDFWQLVDRILSHGMVIWQLNTNGRLLDEGVLDAFEERGVRPSISISFDGTGGWHDWMRGLPGAEQDALRAIRLCRARGLFVHVSMCIHRGNLDTLPQTVDLLCQAGVTSLKVTNVDPTSLWLRHSEGNGFTPSEYQEAVLPYIEWYYRAGRPIQRLELGGIATLRRDAPGEPLVHAYDGTPNSLDCYLCAVTRWSCYITPEGRLLPCMPMTASPHQSRFPKVQDIGLRQGLSSSFYMEFVSRRVKDLLEANPECAACEHRFRCGGGCRARALNTGDHSLMGCDREMCSFWKSGRLDAIQAAIARAEAAEG